MLLSLFWIVEACDDEKEENNAEVETNPETNPVAGQTGGEEENAGGSGTKPPIELNISSKQLGRKWGEHMKHYPDISSYPEYEDKIINIFKDPDRIILDSKNSEYLYIKGDDLLWLKLNGQFVSLYPGVNSSKVTKALNDGGLIWEK